MTKSVPAYVVGQIDIKNSSAYQAYLDGFTPSFERHGGELLASSRQKTTPLEGDWTHPRTVLMRFPTNQAARDWYNDPEYVELRKIRQANALTNLVIVEGWVEDA